jgi:hypothetical protein
MARAPIRRPAAVAWLVSVAAHAAVVALAAALAGRAPRPTAAVTVIDTLAPESRLFLIDDEPPPPKPVPPPPLPPLPQAAPVAPVIEGLPPAPPTRVTPASFRPGPARSATSAVAPAAPAAAAAPGRVVYVLDRSGSMGLSGRFAAARQAVLAEAAALPRGSSFVVIAYNRFVERFPAGDGWHFAGPGGLEELAAWLARLEPEGGSDHDTALRRAARLAAGTVVWVSDADAPAPAGVRRAFPGK